MSVVYDTGALIASERSDRAVWADHRARLELGLVPLTTAPVVAQVSRSGRQAQLRRFLRGCDIVAFGEDDAHEIGALAGRSGSNDVVDVHVVATAHRRRFAVITSDEDDLEPIADTLQPQVPSFESETARRRPRRRTFWRARRRAHRQARIARRTRPALRPCMVRLSGYPYLDGWVRDRPERFVVWFDKYRVKADAEARWRQMQS